MGIGFCLKDCFELFRKLDCQCHNSLPGRYIEATNIMVYPLGRTGYTYLEALRFFPAVMIEACFFVRMAFIFCDLFSIFSMARTRESGIPKFSATLSAETI